MKYTYILLILFAFINCAEKNEITKNENKVYRGTAPLTYLALGDSYTICEGMKSADRWPELFVDQLNADEGNWSSPTVIAKTGWTTRNLLDAIDRNAPKENGYDMVSLLIGVNNQFQGLSYSIFQEEFDALLDLSISFCKDSTAVFVVSIPDYGVTKYGRNNEDAIATELDKYNAYMKSKCEEMDILFIDITEISRELGDSALAPDGLHPNVVQYKEWVKVIRNQIES